MLRDFVEKLAVVHTANIMANGIGRRKNAATATKSKHSQKRLSDGFLNPVSAALHGPVRARFPKVKLSMFQLLKANKPTTSETFVRHHFFIKI